MDSFFIVFFRFPQPEFCNLTHLVKVDLSKNQLCCLPDELGNLTSLQHLDLYNNKLTLLPVSFSQLRVCFPHTQPVVCLHVLEVDLALYPEPEVAGPEGQPSGAQPGEGSRRLSG